MHPAPLPFYREAFSLLFHTSPSSSSPHRAPPPSLPQAGAIFGFIFLCCYCCGGAALLYYFMVYAPQQQARNREQYNAAANVNANQACVRVHVHVLHPFACTCCIPLRAHRAAAPRPHA